MVVGPGGHEKRFLKNQGCEVVGSMMLALAKACRALSLAKNGVLLQDSVTFLG